MIDPIEITRTVRRILERVVGKLSIDKIKEELEKELKRFGKVEINIEELGENNYRLGRIITDYGEYELFAEFSKTCVGLVDTFFWKKKNEV